MAKYEKKEVGLITKQKIVNSAKDLFYKDGFQETTIKAICENADITRSSFFYYFKDKSEIADFISNYVNLKFYDETQKDIKNKYNNQNFLIDVNFYSASFFLSILSDKNLCRFYAETLRNNSDLLLGDNFYRNLFKAMYRFCGHDPDDEMFEIFFTFHTSTPGNLFNQYMKGIIKTPKEKVAEYIMRRVLLGLDITEKEHDDIIRRSMQYYNETTVDFVDIFCQSWMPFSSENSQYYLFL